jgi:hypothetical protein
MVGKAALLYVLGFAVLLGYINLNMNRQASSATDGGAMYYDYEAAHTLAMAGAQLALTALFQDSSWTGPLEYSPSDMPGSYRAVKTGQHIKSVATLSATDGSTIHDTVDVFLGERVYLDNHFSAFAWMANNEKGTHWISGDTIIGRVHSNSRISVSGNPYFGGRVSTTLSFDQMPGEGTNGGTYAAGWGTRAERIELPADLSSQSTAAGVYLYPGEIWLSLSPGTPVEGDGMVYVRTSLGGSPVDSLDLSTSGFAGVIGGRQRVHVQGTLDGRLTVLSLSDIIVEDDLLYERDPRTGSSDDMLGLVAENDVVVADVPANWGNCMIDGSVFCRRGSFRVENHTSTTSGTGGLRGTLYVLGSIIQNNRGPTGSHVGGTLVTGYHKNYVYDTRLSDPLNRPPHYPSFYSWSAPITGWWEGVPRYDFSRLGL